MILAYLVYSCAPEVDCCRGKSSWDPYYFDTGEVILLRPVLSQDLNVGMIALHRRGEMFRLFLWYFAERESMLLSAAKAQTYQSLGWWHLDDLEEYLAVIPEEVATIDMFARDLEDTNV